jgi:hypothetical protein
MVGGTVGHGAALQSGLRSEQRFKSLITEHQCVKPAHWRSRRRPWGPHAPVGEWDTGIHSPSDGDAPLYPVAST